MKIEGTRFGEIDYEDKDLILLPDGMLGMADKQSFLLMDFSEGTPFKWLQSADDCNLGFLAVDPSAFKCEYKPVLRREQLESLDLGNQEDLVLFVLCTWRGSPAESTVNLAGPIVVNSRNRRGCQVVLDGDEYGIREPMSALLDSAQEQDSGNPDQAVNCS